MMRKRFHVVAKIGEVPVGTGKAIVVPECNENILLVCTEKDGYRAVGSLCPHQNELLDRGRLEGDEIVCRRHHLRFDICTGNCTNAGGAYGIPVYEVRIEGDSIMVGVWED